ncbi:FAD-dependent monooxygenase [Nocardiopsis halophila]|uniref:FAD-dependent monooxygenase n=1 Tax=Nocardiopsis halophila TaxID=141692 RepID=UPI00034C17C4|nr:FAD-dependent monooxygenase [Nocardiopsis halophila]
MKALISGAGIAGLAAAHRLAHHGWQVTVLDKAPGPRPQGFMIDFFGPGHDAARTMGLLPAIEQAGHRFRDAAFVDEHGRVRATAPFSAFAQATGGLVSILRPDLEHVLRQALPETVELRYGARVTGARTAPDGAAARLHDGTDLEADLLIGADGIHSPVRRALFGDTPDHLRHLGFHTAAYTFHDPHVHEHVRDRFFLTDTTGAQMGLYGLGNGLIAAFIVFRTQDTHLPHDPRAALRSACSGLGWLVPRALRACPEPDRIYYDHVAQTHVPSWSSGRAVLVGDSAYAVSLLAGQGASLAVGGAYTLAEHLARAATPELGLAAYERAWRPVAEQRRRAALRTAHWFLPRSRTRLHARRLMLGLLALPGTGRLMTRMLTGKPAAHVPAAP